MRKSLYLLIVLLIAAQSNAMQNSEDLEKEAKNGHAEAMWSLAQRCFDGGKYEKGRKWTYRYYIRVEQDAACSKDPSVEAAFTDVVVPWVWGESDPKILDAFPTGEELKQCLSKEVEWVRKLTPTSLPNPRWIANYSRSNPSWINENGRHEFLIPHVALFIAMEECNRNRQEVLDQFVQFVQGPKNQ